MYDKFAAALICLLLCSFNVIAGVKRIPVRTTLESSSRTTVEMMASPNSGVHWFSAVVFLAGFACFLSWGINDYNQLASDDLPQPQPQPQKENQLPVSPQQNISVSPRPVRPVLNSPNVVQFRTRVVSQPGEMSPQEFYERMQQEDIWDEDNSTNSSIS
ncbi:hypothetical protein [Iningainema tapete]|uniref:Transmembrane protein n=1 Tax=Iningainema tapete BLCC-T55 TaxID=2748662 RepID=A0A8J6XBG6_9CYAN|nr:hypothetical protein [Iningainema tapete]MBD2772130.1 hypothetical protein [Iningainema tapete BLCC-T55]